jgi:hypothetical protein
MNLTLVGTSRCDVPAREAAGGIIAPLNAARTAQRAVPTRFKESIREKMFRRIPSLFGGMKVVCAKRNRMRGLA